jgi:hypothetical protein
MTFEIPQTENNRERTGEYRETEGNGSLFDQCFKREVHHRPFGIIRHNLNIFVDWSLPAGDVYLSSYLSLFAGTDMARTSHGCCTSSGRNQFFNDKLFIAGVRDYEAVFQGFSFAHRPKIVVLRLERY